MIQVYGLKKMYGNNKAVDGISFNVRKGDMTALLGPNGAGKSTTLDILSTYKSADEGTVIIDGFVAGEETRRIRERIGMVFQTGALDERLTVEENLRIRAGIYGLRKKISDDLIKSISEITEITNLLQCRYGKLSGGQKRRCDIARGLLNEPSVLFLDEPTAGLDAQVRMNIWNMVDNIRKERAVTVLFTTHYIQEASRADNVIVMKKGQIRAEGSPRQLMKRYSSDKLIMVTDGIERLEYILRYNQISYINNKDSIEIVLERTIDALNILKICKGAFSDFEVIKGNLEAAYIHITGSFTHD